MAGKDEAIVTTCSLFGNKWAKSAKFFPGWTNNQRYTRDAPIAIIGKTRWMNVDYVCIYIFKNYYTIFGLVENK